MVEYFREQFKGFAFTVNDWVQSYRSRYVKPPIIYGDVSWTLPMNFLWSTTTHNMTGRPMKGMQHFNVNDGVWKEKDQTTSTKQYKK